MNTTKKIYLSAAFTLLLPVALMAQHLDREKLSQALPKYKSIGWFSEGLACVTDNENRVGFINKAGEEVIPCIYEVFENSEIIFRDGLAGVKRNGKYGLINREGQEIMPCIYDAFPNNGYWKAGGFAAFERNGKEGVIDSEGNTVVPFIYDWCRIDFLYDSDGNLLVKGAIVSKNGKQGYIDLDTGKEIVPCIYSWVVADEDVIFGDNYNKGTGIYDHKGNVIAPVGTYTFNNYRFNEGMLLVHKNRKVGYIDKTGKVVVPIIYEDFMYDPSGDYMGNIRNLCENDDCIQFQEGLAQVYKNGKVGYVDKTGTLVIPCVHQIVWNSTGFSGGINLMNGYYINKDGKKFGEAYEERESPDRGFAKVKQNGRWGMINNTGKEIIPCQYYETKNQLGTSFVTDFFVVNTEYVALKKNGKWEVLNKNGDAITDLVYDYIVSFYLRENLFKVEKNGKWGIIDTSGKEITPCVYENQEMEFVDGFAKVQKNNKWGFINEQGKEVIPCVYENVDDYFHDGIAKCQFEGKAGLLDTADYFIGHGYVELPYYEQRDKLYSQFLLYFPDKTAFETEYDKIGKTEMLKKAELAKKVYETEREKLYSEYSLYFPDKQEFENEYDTIGKAAMTQKAKEEKQTYETERNDLYARFAKYYPDKAAFEALYDRTGKTEMPAAAQQEADRQDLSAFKQQTVAIAKTGFAKPAKDKLGIIQQVAGFKIRAVYPQVIEFAISNNKALSKKWEKEGRFFASQTDFYEAFVSGNYKEILKGKKK